MICNSKHSCKFLFNIIDFEKMKVHVILKKLNYPNLMVAIIFPK